jgi:anti-sigma regulatory factor (Ser/Thr protein kinase)
VVERARAFAVASGWKESLEVGLRDRSVVEQQLPHSMTAAALARETVRDVLGSRLDTGRLEDATVVATELVSNAFRHAPALPEGGITLVLEDAGGVVRIVVVDGGRDFEPSWPSSAAVSEEPHLGLLFVDALSDRWGISDDGLNAVWAEFDHD